nr:gamma-glutamyl-gamma-aminobutyrate hydrolase family protein [Sediminivirga luteola]
MSTPPAWSWRRSRRPSRTGSACVASNVSEPDTPGATVRRPRIGITTYQQPARWGVWDEEAALLSSTYLDCVVAAGGTPLLLPPTGSDPTLVEDLDGLVIAGGSDVGAERYGAEPHPLTQPQSHRDDHDLALAGAALKAGLPLFAICRGLQVVNTLLGGTLIQHLPDVLDTTAYQPAPGVFGRMRVQTEPGSMAAALLGAEAEVSVYHHQAVDRVGRGLRVTARTADGVIQALELDPDQDDVAAIPDAGGPATDARHASTGPAATAAGHPAPGHASTAAGPEKPGWMLAVQWHPERTVQDLRLFAAFVAAAQAHRDRRHAGTPDPSNSAGSAATPPAPADTISTSAPPDAGGQERPRRDTMRRHQAHERS